MVIKSGNREQGAGSRDKKAAFIMITARSLLVFFFFIFNFSFIFAQEQETPAQNYYIQRDDDEARFIQRLTWQSTDYISHYIVIVEQLYRNRFQEIERKETKENFAEVSLAPGRYRYCVEVYDVFEELFHTTSWREFEVIRALQPVVSGFSPSGFYLDEDDTWVVNVRGRNLLPESTYYFVRSNTNLFPETFSADGNSSRMVFSESSLIPGKYGMYVRNPGGLDTLEGQFTIGYRKPFDLNIALMYSPIIPVRGFLFKDSELDAPFIDSFYFLSGGTRISFMPFKRPWGYLGAEVTGSFSYLKHERENYTISGFLINTHVNLLYQKYFMKKKFSINAAIGVGVSTLMNVVYEYPVGPPSDTFRSINPSAIAGLSFSYFFVKNYFLSAGADYIQMITPAEDGDIPGMVRPFISVGMQF